MHLMSAEPFRSPWNALRYRAFPVNAGAAVGYAMSAIGDIAVVRPKRIDLAPTPKADIESIRSLRQQWPFVRDAANDWIEPKFTDVATPQVRSRTIEPDIRKASAMRTIVRLLP